MRADGAASSRTRPAFSLRCRFCICAAIQALLFQSRPDHSLDAQPKTTCGAPLSPQIDVTVTSQRLRRRFLMDAPMSAVFGFVLSEVAAEAQRRADAAPAELPAGAGTAEGPSALPEGVSEEMMHMLAPGGFNLVLSFQPKPLPNDGTSIKGAGLGKRDKLIARPTA